MDYLTELRHHLRTTLLDETNDGSEASPALVQRVLSRAQDLEHGQYGVGIEVVPYRLVGVLVDRDGHRFADGQRHLESMDIDEVCDAIVDFVTELVALHLGFTLPDDRVTVCVQLGGPVDRSKKVVLFYHKNPASTSMSDGPPPFRWEQVPLARILEKRLGVPVFVENDANAFAVYQQWFGAGQGVETFGVMLIREGVGGSMVMDHRVLKAPMEIGNLVVRPDGGRICDCGHQGCLEVSAGTSGITEAAAMFAAQEIRTLVDAVELAADVNHPAAVKVMPAFTGAGLAAAHGIAFLLTLHAPTLMVLYAPDVLVGSRTPAADAFLEEVNRFKEYVSHQPFGDCQLVIEAIRPYEGAHGAALAALDQRAELSAGVTDGRSAAGRAGRP
jgi:glucokinase